MSALLALAAGAALLAVSAAPASGAATRAEFAAAAEPVCADASAEIRSLNKQARRSAKRGRDRTAGRTIKRIGGVFSGSISDVRRIAPPPGDEALIADWLGLMGQVGSNLKAMGRAHMKGQIGRRNNLFLRNQEIGTAAITLTRDWGFHACAGEQMPALGPLPSGRWR
jgi:hypothetical protein